MRECNIPEARLWVRRALGLVFITAVSCGFLLLGVMLPGTISSVSAQQMGTAECAGFFSGEITAIAVRATSTDDSMTRVLEPVARQIDAATPDHITVFVGGADSMDHVILIDDEIASPGQPSVFTVDGTSSLFLHWTTAAEDLISLVDASGPCAAISAPLAQPDTEQNGVVVSVPPAPPLADTTPNRPVRWPYHLGAVALATGGGAALYRRSVRLTEEDNDIAATPERPVDPTNASDSDSDSDSDSEATRQSPRIISVSTSSVVQKPKPVGTRRVIDLEAERPESPLVRLVERVAALSADSELSDEFAREVHRHWSRHWRGETDGAVASLVLPDVEAVRLRLGDKAADALFRVVTRKVAEMARPGDVIGVAGDNELVVLMPEIDEESARAWLAEISTELASTAFRAYGERVLLTPAAGFAMFSDADTGAGVVRSAESARAASMRHLQLHPERWQAATGADANRDVTTTSVRAAWLSLKETLRTPVQILVTFLLAWVIPFFVYLGFYAAGLDISYGMYLFFVAALAVTGGFILAEGKMAKRQSEPPEIPSTPYPKATALIAAYMPNEAATIVETIDAFLAVEYPNELQIILAYNTPEPMEIEEQLDRIAVEHPNFVPVRVVGSTSKAQNVNAALSMADGAIVGMFDADHQPRADVFTRAWRWVDAGYDVVQGHCLTRNGEDGWLVKMIAVEFESIYAVAHPGRAKMHRFGVFGGSNGFWRTELLHETRMRGSMLTEDIDSSMRVVERGHKIRSDRNLVSRELGTTTFGQVWNQRMRWAQGWFQVSLEHVRSAMQSSHLTGRQKAGIFHLLLWREAYPWLSQQLFPLLAFWAVRAGGLERLDWAIPVFVATTIFTFSVGPMQTWFAYRHSDPEIKQHRSWFWGYLFFNTFFYSEYKNLIARVAHVKEFMGESNWRVTPRS